ELEFGGGHLGAVEAGGLREKISEPVEPNAKGVGLQRHAFSSRSREEIRAARVPVPEETSFMPDRTGPDFLNNAGILLAKRAVANLGAHECFRIPRALVRIVDHAVGY